MYNARVVTQWVAATTERGNHPRIDDDHNLYSWSDVTGQSVDVISPDPNAYTVEVVCDEVTLDALEADDNCVVMWSEEIIEEVP